MKVVSTDALTKLIQLVKGTFIKNTDVVQTTEVTLADVAITGAYSDLSGTPTIPTTTNSVTSDSTAALTSGGAYTALQGYANTSLSNLSSDGQMIVDSQNGTISNCILEIPQKIKLEISGTTITIKSGSEIVLSGSSTYTTSTISTDITGDFSTWANGEYLLAFYNNNLTAYLKTQTGSGDSLPADGSTYNKFYLTTDYSIYTWGSSSWTKQTGASYPLCLFIKDSSGLHFVKDSNSHDMIFNGFGFIGNSVFAFPNVKVLLPNGKDNKNRLKSIFYNNQSVLIYTWGTSGSFYFVIKENAINLYGISSSRYYDQDTNYTIINGNSNWLILGTVVKTTTTFTNFTIRQPVRTATTEMLEDIQDQVDTNTYDIANNIVKTTGDQTIAGDKTFTSSPKTSLATSDSSAQYNDGYKITDSSLDTSVNPAYSKTYYYAVKDKNNRYSSYIASTYGTDGSSQTSIATRTRNTDNSGDVGNSISIKAYRNGTVTTFAPAPAATNNTTDSNIATVGWVNDSSKSTNVLHRSGNETAAGNKTFTGTFTLQASSVGPILKSTSYTKGTAPTNDTYLCHRNYQDTNGVNVFDEYYYIPNNTNKPTYLLRFRNVSSASATSYKDIINANYDGTDSNYIIGANVAKAPTPTEDTTTSTQIDTVGARNTKLANYALDNSVVKLTGNQTIAGIKTFSDNINANASVTVGQHAVISYNSSTEAIDFTFS